MVLDGTEVQNASLTDVLNAKQVSGYSGDRKSIVMVVAENLTGKDFHKALIQTFYRS